MLESPEIGELGMKIGHDQRIAEAVATASLTAFDCFCYCRAQHDVVQRACKRQEGREPVRSHDAIENDEITRLGIATCDIGGDLHDHAVLLIGFGKPGIDAAMLDVSPQIIAMKMNLWHAAQVRKGFGDCGLARAWVAGEKQDMAVKIVCHGHTLTRGRHSAADCTVIGQSCQSGVSRPRR
ncbi:hypothetical protein AGR1B_Lc70044 [Agrobacterium fabacearum S56]|nr:hypothetical protein AGR1B_Lc70044 [Agrobacterium fabacearum S56]